MMEKLAALVPRPRVHLTRFHGVLGPHYKYRKQIVPKKISPPALIDAEAVSDISATSDKPTSRSKRMSWARLLKRVFGIDPPKLAKSVEISTRKWRNHYARAAPTVSHTSLIA
jgi:hypothetical protein